MADRPVALTEADARILQRMIDREKRQTINAPQVFDHSDRGDDQQAPETYVARVPSDGIPELVTAYTISDDEPGSKECYIYQVVNGPDIPRLIQVSELQQRVYNISTSSITGDTWLPITRDKFGRWIALAGSGGGGSQSVYFRILNFCPELFAYGQGCACYEAEVTRVLCSSSIIVGDIITIRDPDRCWLNLPADLLFDRKGKATLFKTGTDNGGLHCETDESALQVPGCIWIVDFLCCVEEDYATAF